MQKSFTHAEELARALARYIAERPRDHFICDAAGAKFAVLADQERWPRKASFLV